jgi:hypothetical protein
VTLFSDDRANAVAGVMSDEQLAHRLRVIVANPSYLSGKERDATLREAARRLDAR